MSARSDFGARLSQAREKRGLSLRDIAATTKISVSALEALEHGDASRLPGGIFSRAFVRSYAEEVGLDQDKTVREFLELFPSETNPIANPVAVSLPVDDTRERPWGRMLFGSFVLAAAAGTAFVLMGWVSTDWLRAARDTQQVQAAPMPDLPAAPEPTVARPFQSPAPESSSGVVPDPVATTSDSGATVQDVYQVSQSDTLRLSVQATARCWVHIVADGSVVFAREMLAGEREVREAKASFVVTVGNAGAFVYSINDAPGRPLGGDGKVVKVRIDRSSLPEFLAN